MPTLLITGASRGLGLEFVRQYAKAGWQVIATCRKPDKADALRTLAAGADGRIEVEPLDVVDRTATERLAKTLRRRPIDLLIANAGVMGPRAYSAKLDDATWGEVLRVNVMAPLRLATLLTESVAASERKLMACLIRRPLSAGVTRSSAGVGEGAQHRPMLKR